MIPTYGAEPVIGSLLTILKKDSDSIPILVIDSSSKDRTVEIAQSHKVQVEVIKQSDFNHGLTREYARKRVGTDIVVMMTQDIIPVTENLIDILVAPLLSGEASISYARQLPHLGAGFFEAFPREYNYPLKSEIRSLEDTKKYGSFAYFCSDSCAAWSNSALDEIGGFDPVLLGEDAVATAKLLKRGHKIAYVAEARVRHSHSYSLIEDMKRYFDAGFERNRLGRLLLSESKDEKRGASFTKAMFKRLVVENKAQIPYGLLTIASKYVGYKLGQNARIFPSWVYPKLSSQPYYWSSRFASTNAEREG